MASKGSRKTKTATMGGKKMISFNVEQKEGFSVVSFEIEGDVETTGRFIDRLRLPYIGPTLGGVESIVEQPAVLFSLDPAERRKVGLGDSLVRYALGIEDADDLIADLSQALDDI